MHTINVSLPSKLKSQADDMVKAGYYASFSDLVRTALRQTLSEINLEALAGQAVREHQSGQALILHDSQDVDTYLDEVFDKDKNK